MDPQPSANPSAAFATFSLFATLMSVQPKYYGNNAEAMVAEVRGMREQGCNFLVAGRVVDGQFHVRI